MSTRVCRVVGWIFSALVSLLLASISTVVAAEEPEQPLAGLHHSAWTTKDGAPGTVIAIAQTSDGYLWIASQVGLYRFDGVRFQRFTPLPGQAEINGAVQSLFAPSSGGLWVGMYYGGAFFVEAGKVKTFGVREGLPKRASTRFAQDLDGRMWLTSTKGLYRLEGERWARQDGIDDSADALLLSLVVDREGTVWASGYGPAMLEIRRGETSPHRFPISKGTQPSLLLDRSGVAWTDDGASLMTLSGTGARAVASPLPSGIGRSNSTLLFDSQGSLWLTIEGKILRVTHASEMTLPPPSRHLKVEKLNADELLSGPQPRTAFEDREGNVWVGTHGGLDRFRSNKLSSPFAENPGDLKSGPTLLAVEGGNMLAGTLGNGLIKIGTKLDFTNFLAGDGPRGGIQRIYRDPSGTIWLAGRGELWHGKDGAFTRDEPAFGGALREVDAVCMDPEGSLWVAATGFPPWVLKGGRWIPGGGIDGLPAASPTTMDSDGKRLWIGYQDNRIALVEAGRVRILDDTQGLAIGPVMVVRPQRDVVWVGGQNGLSVYRSGRFRQVAIRGGEKLRGISGIAQTVSGELWLNGADGIVRISAAEVSKLLENPDYAVETEILDVRDGLKGLASQARPLGTAFVATDSRVWFTTMSGIFWIDPAHVQRSAFKPPVIIESMVSDGSTYPQGQGAPPSVDGTDIQINYTSTSLTMPERIRFRYRLGGFDAEWHDAGGRRQAFFTKLRPGSYRFQVVAVNADGVASQDAAELDFSVPPAFYETTWFRLLVLLLIAITAVLLYRVRLRQVATRIQLDVEARHQERERIARELHDTILQETQGLVLSFQALAGKLRSDDEVRRSMEGLLDHADNTLALARQSVSDLRIPESEQTGLVERFEALSAELAPDQIPVNLHVHGVEPCLTHRVRTEIYRVGREAVLNALRHANATVVDITLTFEGRRLRMLVRDDGIGISDATRDSSGRPGHWGLVGMRERAIQIGAEFAIMSLPGQGTTIELVLEDGDAPRRGIAAFWPGGRLSRFLSS